MSQALSNDFKEVVRSRTSLVDLVSESVSLKPLHGGRDYVGLCPFHDDHRPSFHVYPDRQSYRCWVCAEGGDCFSFVMKHEGVGFREALEILARRVHLEVPRSNARGSAPRNADAPSDSGDASSMGSSMGSSISKPELYDVLAWAERVFHDCLLKSSQAAPARDYLRGRGFTDETIARFRLGYHPDEWEWLQALARGKFSRNQLLAAKLIAENPTHAGRFYDYYVGRAIFPIHDSSGRAVSFGGRILPGHAKPDAAKYFNGPDSPVFHKGKLVFGLNVARDTLRKMDMAVDDVSTAIVVEGYADCIMCQQHGLSNVVGTLGTALAESHVQLLKRFAKRVVLVFDGDEAGRRAAERALPKFLAQDVDLRVLTLPEGSKDPDDYLQQHGAEAFRALIARAADVLDYKLDCLKGRYGLDSAAARERVLAEMLELVATSRGLAGTDREHLILGRMAHALAMPPAALHAGLQKARRQAERSPAARGVQSDRGLPPAASPSRRIGLLHGERTRDDADECEILEILLADPSSIDEVRAHVSATDFRNEHLRDLYQVCDDLAERGEFDTADRLLAALDDTELKKLAVLLDESSRTKGVGDLVRVARKSPPIGQPHIPLGDPMPGRRPSFLEQAIGRITFRRHEESHAESKLRIAEIREGSGLDPGARALLERVAAYHAERNAKKARHG